jgi:ubiquinone/menaquinone biosynthesis C-methylase UbiE
MAETSHPFFSAIYPWLNANLDRRWLRAVRASLLAPLEGEVLEIGAGHGANVEHYAKAKKVIVAEPDASLRRKLARNVARAKVPIDVSDAAGESLPFRDASFDVVVSTLVLCSVHDVDATLAEVRRVLRPGARFVFVEHVRKNGEDGRWQDRLRPIWSFVMGGCQLNRNTIDSIERAGMHVEGLEPHRPDALPPFVWPVMIGAALKTIAKD